MIRKMMDDDVCVMDNDEDENTQNMFDNFTGATCDKLSGVNTRLSPLCRSDTSQTLPITLSIYMPKPIINTFSFL